MEGTRGVPPHKAPVPPEGEDVFVLMHDLANGERIPMGTPSEEINPIEAYDGFVSRDRDTLEEQKSELVDFRKDYQDSVHIRSGRLQPDGTIVVDGRTWTRDAICAEHGVEGPAP